MSKFWMVTEDPEYNEDGQLVDEDFDECEETVEVDEEHDAYFGA
jgi:hypothetical protein